jgi:NAD(P)-dependent dehydrogenase (short-subunit alcohol dehydrogenase family)
VFEIRDKHILVTGGSSGFGRHFSRFLASNGAKVTLAARRAEALASAVAEITAGGDRAQSVQMDVTQTASIQESIKQAEAAFGPIHGVVNNAGVTATKPALDQDERSWDTVIDTNLKGVWLVAQAAVQRIVENKVKGSIVNIASILGLRVAGAVAPYAISKAGVIQLTKVLALEWSRYGIRVNALAASRSAQRTGWTAAAADLQCRIVHDRQRCHRRWWTHGFRSMTRLGTRAAACPDHGYRLCLGPKLDAWLGQRSAGPRLVALVV